VTVEEVGFYHSSFEAEDFKEDGPSRSPGDRPEAVSMQICSVGSPLYKLVLYHPSLESEGPVHSQPKKRYPLLAPLQGTRNPLSHFVGVANVSSM
jgi:hypothetical protein